MAGTITHLVIADKVLERLPEPIKRKIHNKSLFYCGNLAPDAIMARANYERSMKRHTHFKDDVRSNELHLPEKFAQYRKRLEAFAERFLVQPHKDYELYFGYVVHILADEVFILKVRDTHVKRLLQEGKNTEDARNFRTFGHDVDLNDWRLVREYPFSCDILRMIQAESNYEIEDYITKEELNDSKDFIIKKNFLTEHDAEEASELTYEENLRYIEEAVDTIIAYVEQSIE